MERARSLTWAVVGAAVLAAAPGCVVPQKADPPRIEAKAGEAVVTADMKAKAGVADGAVKPAAAAVPAVTSFQMPSMAKLTGKDRPGAPANDIMVAWRKKIEYLPDPSKDGSMGPGLVGQMFLFTTTSQFAPADGRLVVEMFDETTRAVQPQPKAPVRLGRWCFEKDVLKRLVTVDERFGKCYALFLPWPDYRPDVTKVRLTVKYEPEHGHPLYAEPFLMVIDNGQPAALAGFGSADSLPVGGPPVGATGFAPPAAGMMPPAGFGGLPPGAAGFAPPTAGMVMPPAGYPQVPPGGVGTIVIPRSGQ